MKLLFKNINNSNKQKEIKINKSVKHYKYNITMIYNIG